jgi:monoamine oxidase
MASSDYDVVIVGGGAAGIGAGRRLHGAGVSCLIVEARERLGGRGWTTTVEPGFALDLGCGWLHSADHNPWVAIAEAQGRSIDRSPPPWSKPSLPYDFSLDEQDDFHEALGHFFAQVEAANGKPDRPASELLTPGGRWNALINALNTYISGAELERLSLQDLANYAGNDVNWRVVEGYGGTIAAHGAGVPTALGCPVLAIDHNGTQIKIDTTEGRLTAAHVIVTLPTSLLAIEAVRFTPALPEKTEAAHGLPLGLADKLFLSLDRPEEFDGDCSLFGNINRTATAAYQFRPFDRPMIEAYFGGQQAAELEAGGDAAFFDFAVSELTARLGSDFAKRVKPIAIHRWGTDQWARGSYSFALPGKAACRQTLAAPVDGRLFFAGEACSKHDFSTAHGALETGIAAAEQVLAARQGQEAL